MENAKSTVKPPKTVIFRHPAAVFKLDENIMRNAMFIDTQKPDDKEVPCVYYSEAIRRAAESDKLYIVMDYSNIITFYYKLILSRTHNYNFMDWNFITFFHNDEVSGGKQKSRTIPDAVKSDIFTTVLQFGFILKYTIKPGYTVTERDIKAIKDFWEKPEDIKSFKECFAIPREPPFPFYDCLSALKGIIRKGEESWETIAAGENHPTNAAAPKGTASIQKTRRLHRSRTQQWKKRRSENQRRRSRGADQRAKDNVLFQKTGKNRRGKVNIA